MILELAFIEFVGFLVCRPDFETFKEQVRGALLERRYLLQKLELPADKREPIEVQLGFRPIHDVGKRDIVLAGDIGQIGQLLP